MVVITAGAGLVLAESVSYGTAHAGLGLWRTIATLAGTSAIVGAANALNCLLEKDVDAYMERTQDRPLVTGRLSDTTALVFGLGLAALSLVTLWLAANPLTALLGLLGFLSYVAVYTPLKRRSPDAVFVGAIPGAIPPLMGWAAVANRLDMGAWILFGILFFWQLPHFIAISIYRQAEYEAAGLKTIPGTRGSHAANQHLLLWTASLVAVSLAPYVGGLAGTSYLMVTLALGILFTSLSAASVMKIRDLNWSRAVFFGSLAYLPLVLGTWVLETWFN